MGRVVSASNDGGRWVFDQFGEPFPFEKVERYQERRVRDRFTFEMLKEYLPEGAPAWLVEKTGPVVASHQEYTLAQARERLL